MYKSRYEFPKLSKDVLCSGEWGNLRMFYSRDFKSLDNITSKMGTKGIKGKLSYKENKVYFL